MDLPCGFSAHPSSAGTASGKLAGLDHPKPGEKLAEGLFGVGAYPAEGGHVGGKQADSRRRLKSLAFCPSGPPPLARGGTPRGPSAGEVLRALGGGEGGQGGKAGGSVACDGLRTAGSDNPCLGGGKVESFGDHRFWPGAQNIERAANLSPPRRKNRGSLMPAGRRAFWRTLMLMPMPTTIPTLRIHVPDNARKPDPGLVASIGRLGVLQPVGVKVDGEGYAVVFGCRRIQAARTLGLETVPAVVFPSLSPAEEKTMTIVENLQRQNLSALEAGALFLDLLALGLSLGEVSKMVSRPASYISARVVIAQLPQAARDLIAGIPHNVSALALLARLPAPALIDLLERNPACAGSVDLARDAVRAAGRPLDSSPFSLDDCGPCERKTGGLCLDGDCWGRKLAESVGERIAELRRGRGYQTAPCVVARADADFASEEDRGIFKRFAAAPLRHQRLAAHGEDGTPAILLGPAGEVRPVRIVPQRATAPGDGRTDRFTRADHRDAVAEREAAVQLAGKLRERLASGELDVGEDLGELCRALAELVVLHPVDDVGALATLARLALPRISAWAQVSAVSRPLGGWRTFNANLRRLLGEE